MIKLHTHNGEHFVVIANQVWKFKRIESAWAFIFGIVHVGKTKENGR